MIDTAQQTAQKLSDAFSHIISEAEKASTARVEQSTKLADTLTASFIEAQQEASQILTSLAKHLNAQVEVSMEIGKAFLPTLDGKAPLGFKAALEKQFELDKELFQDVSARVVSLQNRQVATGKALLGPTVGFLEAGIKQSEIVVKYGETLLDAYQSFAKGLSAMAPAAQPKS